jgi:4-hydroxy-tetrahydrodipicolinate synthase
MELSGVVVPMITPLKADGALDGAGAQRLTERLIERGVNGLLVAGTTGEVMALPARVRIEAFQRVTRAAERRAAVLACVGADCLEDVLAYMEAADRAGVDAVVVQPPGYHPLDQADLAAFYRLIVSRSRRPVVLYNIPSCARSAITPALAAALAADPKVAGLKDSGGDMAVFAQFIALRRPDFRVLIGSENRLLESLKMGADGFVPGSGNLCAELCVALMKAARDGQWESVAALIEELHRRAPRPGAGRSWCDTIEEIKRLLSEEGICQPFMAGIFASRGGAR